MNKIKIILICLLIPFCALAVFTFSKIKNKEEYQQKIALAKEMRKAMEHLMLDLLEARKDTLLDAPADGLWHNRIAFTHVQLGNLEYLIKNRHLLRINNGNQLLIADDIGDFRIRRQKDTPDIVEVQIKAQKNVSLISNLKIRIRQ